MYNFFFLVRHNYFPICVASIAVSNLWFVHNLVAIVFLNLDNVPARLVFEQHFPTFESSYSHSISGGYFFLQKLLFHYLHQGIGLFRPVLRKISSFGGGYPKLATRFLSSVFTNHWREVGNVQFVPFCFQVLWFLTLLFLWALVDLV